MGPLFRDRPCALLSGRVKPPVHNESKEAFCLWKGAGMERLIRGAPATKGGGGKRGGGGGWGGEIGPGKGGMATLLMLQPKSETR